MNKFNVLQGSTISDFSVVYKKLLKESILESLIEFEAIKQQGGYVDPDTGVYMSYEYMMNQENDLRNTLNDILCEESQEDFPF